MKDHPRAEVSSFSIETSQMNQINQEILDEHLAKRAHGERKDIRMEAIWPEQLETIVIPPTSKYQSMGVTKTADGYVRCWVLDTFTGQVMCIDDPKLQEGENDG